MSERVAVDRTSSVVTLDDVSAIAAADELRRYELSPEGVLTISPPPGYAHAIVATRLTAWLTTTVPVDRVTQAIGLRIPGPAGGVGGRIPDLVVWSKPQGRGIWLPAGDALLVVEIVSPGSEGVDTVTKRGEYAVAGIPQYWTVSHDAAQTVTMHTLAEGHYALRATMPLAWVLNTTPSEHELSAQA